MKETKYIRKGDTITNLETGNVDQYQFISGAKRKSRELQLSNDGALGRGSLRVK